MSIKFNKTAIELCQIFEKRIDAGECEAGREPQE